MIQGLKGHACSQGPIADYRHDAPALAELSGRNGHPKRGTDGSARVADAEGVVLAFGAARERSQSPGLLDRGQAFAPTRERLVRIGLVPDVPHKAVVGSLEHVV